MTGQAEREVDAEGDRAAGLGAQARHPGGDIADRFGGRDFPGGVAPFSAGLPALAGIQAPIGMDREQGGFGPLRAAFVLFR